MRALLIFLSINVASVTSFLPRQGAFVWYKHQQPLSLALWSLKSSSQQQPYDVDGPLVAVSPTRTRSNGSRVPRLSKGSWGQLLDAIRLYHAIHGDLLVEDGWCVPREPPWPHQLWGKRLARLVYDMGFWQTHVAQFPARRADLEKLGFVWGRLQSEYNLVVEALLVYRELHGDLLVPADFVVPSGAFNNHPHPYSSTGNNIYGNRSNEALSLDQVEAAGGDIIDIVNKSKAAQNNPWPRSCWKMRLGQRVAAIRSRNDYLRAHPERWYQLDGMGFVWEANEVKWDRVLLALQTYCRRYHHVMVPRSFTVPESEFDPEGRLDFADEDEFSPGKGGPNRWPRSTWGLKLGVAVANIRSKRTFLGETVQRDPAPPLAAAATDNCDVVFSRPAQPGDIAYPERLRALRKLGFAFDPGEFRFEQLVAGLRAFREVHGHTRVPQKFVVPRESPYPQPCWEMKLGSQLSMVRTRGYLVRNSPQRRERLNMLEIKW